MARTLERGFLIKGAALIASMANEYAQPKCRRTSLVAAANIASGGVPRATSVASRRSAA
jgi:hypothetical protein